MANTQLVNSIKEYIATKPRHFAEVVQEFPAHPYREVLRAWSAIREEGLFARDEEGHYLIKSK